MIASHDQYIVIFFPNIYNYNSNIKYRFVVTEITDNKLINIHEQETSDPYYRCRLSYNKKYNIGQYQYMYSSNGSWILKDSYYYSNYECPKDNYNEEDAIWLELLFPEEILKNGKVYENDFILFSWLSLNAKNINIKIENINTGKIIINSDVNTYPLFKMRGDILTGDNFYKVDIIISNNTDTVRTYKMTFQYIKKSTNKKNEEIKSYPFSTLRKIHKKNIKNISNTDSSFIKLISTNTNETMSSLITYSLNKELKNGIKYKYKLKEPLDNKLDFIVQYFKDDISIIKEEMFYSKLKLLSIYIPSNTILTIFNSDNFKKYLDFCIIGPAILYDTYTQVRFKQNLFKERDKCIIKGERTLDNEISYLYIDNLKKSIEHKSLRLFTYNDSNVEQNNTNDILNHLVKKGTINVYTEINLLNEYLLERLYNKTIVNFSINEEIVEEYNKKRRIKEQLLYKKKNSSFSKLTNKIEYEKDPSSYIK